MTVGAATSCHTQDAESYTRAFAIDEHVTFVVGSNESGRTF